MSHSLYLVVGSDELALTVEDFLGSPYGAFDVVLEVVFEEVDVAGVEESGFSTVVEGVDDGAVDAALWLVRGAVSGSEV